MNIGGIVDSLHSGLNELKARFFLPGGSEFTDSLTVGQIIKGRVLRHYEGSRYLVDFDGQEKVVDSATPLRTQELIYGRVVGLGERVELQRIRDKTAEPQQTPAKTAAPEFGFAGGKAQQLMQQIMEKYQGKLATQDSEALLRLMNNSSDPEAMALAGVALSKLGLSITPELLRTVFNAWFSSRRGAFPLDATAAQLESARAAKTFVTKDTVEQFSQVLAWAISDIPEKKYLESIMPSAREADAPVRGPAADSINGDATGGGVSGSMQHDTPDLGRLVLNAQTEGVVSHRLGTLPIRLNDQLIEVDIAMFEQRKGKVKEGIRHRQLVFSLNTENLGHVEVTAKIAGEHLRICVSTEDQEKTELASRYLGQLRGTLAEFGWQVDELIYETRASDERGEVVGAVIEHIVSQDSLSRLM